MIIIWELATVHNLCGVDWISHVSIEYVGNGVDVGCRVRCFFDYSHAQELGSHHD